MKTEIMIQFTEDILGLTTLNDLSFLKDKLAEEAAEYINGWMKTDEENMQEEIFDLFVVTMQIWTMWSLKTQMETYNKWRKKHWEVIRDGLAELDKLRRGLATTESVHSDPESGSPDAIGTRDQKNVLPSKRRHLANGIDDGASE